MLGGGGGGARGAGLRLRRGSDLFHVIPQLDLGHWDPLRDRGDLDLQIRNLLSQLPNLRLYSFTFLKNKQYGLECKAIGYTKLILNARRGVGR